MYYSVFLCGHCKTRTYNSENYRERAHRPSRLLPRCCRCYRCSPLVASPVLGENQNTVVHKRLLLALYLGKALVGVLDEQQRRCGPWYPLGRKRAADTPRGRLLGLPASAPTHAPPLWERHFLGNRLGTRAPRNPARKGFVRLPAATAGSPTDCGRGRPLHPTSRRCP